MKIAGLDNKDHDFELTDLALYGEFIEFECINCGIRLKREKISSNTFQNPYDIFLLWIPKLRGWFDIDISTDEYYERFCYDFIIENIIK